MSDCQIIAFVITGELPGIESEVFFGLKSKANSAVTKTWYHSYKLHLINSTSGFFHSMDLIKVGVHDVLYLPQVKYSGLCNYILLADKGYLSGSQQLDLFTSCSLKPETPMRANQKDYTLYSPFFRKFRKRIETIFSQLCGQFMLKRNYAKTLVGLSLRILTKVTSVT